MAALRSAVEAAAGLLSATASGVARFEVPLPRGATALNWLRGQPRGGCHQVYFSGRCSTAPDTPGTAAAEAGARTFSATAGYAAAWLWQGEPGQPCDEATMAGMQRFLAPSAPRVRVLGGMRFNAQQRGAPEWEPYGSYCFLLPQLEFTESAGCCLLAVNVAWDARYQQQGASGQQLGSSCAGEGPACAADALEAALRALDAMQAPATASAPGFALRVAGGGEGSSDAGTAAGRAANLSQHAQHTPSRDAWERSLGTLLPQLAPDASLRPPPGGLAGLDTDMALQDFVSGGQQGLDELIAAITGERPEGSGAGGSDASAQPPPAAPAAAAPSAAPMTKVVMARRTGLAFDGHLEPLQLLAALQERDPRAYQLYLSVPGAPGAFLGSSPERLYVRSGRNMASEAVAGTRARGAPGAYAGPMHASWEGTASCAPSKPSVSAPRAPRLALLLAQAPRLPRPCSLPHPPFKIPTLKSALKTLQKNTIAPLAHCQVTWRLTFTWASSCCGQRRTTPSSP